MGRPKGAKGTSGRSQGECEASARGVKGECEGGVLAPMGPRGGLARGQFEHMIKATKGDDLTRIVNF